MAIFCCALLVFLRIWYLDEDVLAARQDASPQYEYACTWPCRVLHWVELANVVLVVISTSVLTYMFDEPEERSWCGRICSRLCTFQCDISSDVTDRYRTSQPEVTETVSPPRHLSKLKIGLPVGLVGTCIAGWPW